MLPILFNKYGILIYSYPLFLGIAWMSGYYLIPETLRLKKYFNLLFWGNFLFGWIGAKAFYLLHSGGAAKFFLAQEFSFWLGGGFVFYGGFITAALFSILFVNLNKANWEFSNLKSFIPSLIIGHALGRIGCLFAGCCFGLVTSSPLSIFMHQANRHPTQVYESIGLFGLFFIYRQKSEVSTYLIGYGVLRFLIEFIRGDSSRGFVGPLSQSQVIALILIFIGFCLIFIKQKKARS